MPRPSGSSSNGRRSYVAPTNEATTTRTGPAAVRVPTTFPPNTCPAAPARETVNPVVGAGAGGGKKAPESEMISNRPWNVTVAPGVVGCRSVTLETVPLALITHTPLCRLRAKVATLSPTSQPPATSSTCGRIAFPLSRVMMMGGFGLFLEPGGLPLGFRLPSPG
jgi:hypothetical protein